MPTTSGYRLVLPPGWVQVPVRDAVPGTAHEVIATAFSRHPEGIPRNSFASAKIELERRLENMIRKAKNEGGLELFLACGRAYANPVLASFLIAKGSLGLASDDPLAVVTAVAEGAARSGGKPGRLTALDGAPAARVERIAGFVIPARAARGAVPGRQPRPSPEDVGRGRRAGRGGGGDLLPTAYCTKSGPTSLPAQLLDAHHQL